MRYDDKIKFLERNKCFEEHFTNYGYQQVQGIDCPSLENQNYVSCKFRDLFDDLITFLKTDPSFEMIEGYLIEQIDDFDKQGLIWIEYNQIMLCYTAIISFTFGLHSVRSYYDLLIS